MAFGPLVDTAWLAGNLEDPTLRVVDVRWYLDPARRGREAFLRAHIPGAWFLDVDADLSAPGGRPGGGLGRHPWPSVAQVGRVMGAAGIASDTTVVAYDDVAGATAARAWYVLRAHGHDRVAVLDGGFARWLDEGRPTESGDVPRPPPAAFTPRPRPGWVVTRQEITAPGAKLLLLDARAEQRYRGEVEPVDPRAGHIPGARSAPFSENLTADATPIFLAPDVLRRRYAALGAERVAPIVYCGSGVNACHDLLALELAGLRGRLYAGSWSEWSADPELPVATGPEP